MFSLECKFKNSQSFQNRSQDLQAELTFIRITYEISQNEMLIFPIIYDYCKSNESSLKQKPQNDM